MNITLWIPAAESPRWPCVWSWLNIDKPEGVNIRFVRSGANNVKYSWNRIVEDFLKTDDEWLFSVHNDVVFHPQTLKRLLSWNQPIVSGMIFMRQSPTLPHIWKNYKDEPYYAMRVKDTFEWLMKHADAIKFGEQVIEPRPDDALTPVSFTSTSCMLIHRSVLEKMGGDWFLWDDDYNGGGEDRRFCENAAKLGFTTYVDRSVICGHLVGDIPTSAADFIMWTQASEYNGTGEQ